MNETVLSLAVHKPRANESWTHRNVIWRRKRRPYTINTSAFKIKYTFEQFDANLVLSHFLVSQGVLCYKRRLPEPAAERPTMYLMISYPITRRVLGACSNSINIMA